MMPSIREGLCYTINNYAGKHIGPGDQSVASDRGKRVKALLFHEERKLVQVIDVEDCRSRFTVAVGCLDSI